MAANETSIRTTFQVSDKVTELAATLSGALRFRVSKGDALAAALEVAEKHMDEVRKAVKR
jgi:hypothetical protein